MHKTKVKFAPAYIFLASVKHRLMDDIPLEESFAFYKSKGIVLQHTTFAEFLEACSVVFLSHTIQTKELISTNNTVNTYLSTMLHRAERNYEKLTKEVDNGRKANS
jgi:hypothetical protein